MMDMNNKKINDEFKKINEMVSKLNFELSDIKRQINAVNSSQKPGTILVSDKIKETFRNESDSSKSDPKPRYGGYTSEDVSINKMFYFGNKK